MHLIDISQALSPETAVWPGDQPFEWHWTTRLQEGASVNLGAIQLSTHTATHVDAPLHVRSEGSSTSAFSLEDFVGLAQVIDATEAESIGPAHVREVQADRLLFKTGPSTLSAEEWPESITTLDPTVVPLLQKKNITLIGTDAPSVDALESSDLRAHHALIDADILNIEGLDLKGVSPGLYSLLALPLKLTEADAAPIRAVLGDASLLE